VDFRFACASEEAVAARKRTAPAVPSSPHQTRLVGTRRDELKGGRVFFNDLRNVTDSGKRNLRRRHRVRRHHWAAIQAHFSFTATWSGSMACPGSLDVRAMIASAHPMSSSAICGCLLSEFPSAGPTLIRVLVCSSRQTEMFRRRFGEHIYLRTVGSRRAAACRQPCGQNRTANPADDAPMKQSLMQSPACDEYRRGSALVKRAGA